MENSYDVVVIGGGVGGYIAAIRAAKRGLKVALAEREHLGGVCLNWGCIPTKALLRNAEVLNLVRDAAKYGVDIDPSAIKVSYAAGQKRSREASDKLTKGVEFLMKKNKIDVFMGIAKLADPHTVELLPSGQKLVGKNLILATGSRSSMIPGVENDGKRVLNAHDALSLTALPKSAVILGAGAIGTEFASVWQAYGVDVTIIEMLPTLLPLEDAEVGEAIAKSYKAKGIRILTGTRVEKVETGKDGVTIHANDGKATTAIQADLLLVSAGIRPNTEGLGLEAAGVKTERGYVPIDDEMRTNVRHIFAIGDITGKIALAHTASAQGIVAADTIAGRATRPIEYHRIPRCTYSFPEAASIGWTEKQALEKGYAVKVGRFPLSANGKAIATGEPEGFAKIVIDEKYGEILGVSLVGAHVTELLTGPAALLALEATLEELTGIVFAHPSIGEAILEAAHVAEGLSLNI